MRRLGLLGRDIDYSFSKGYFTKKFTAEKLPFRYENFDLESISQFPELIKNNPDIVAMNVTIPYKEQVMSYLDKIDAEAAEIGAVNTISILKNGHLKGYNTDFHGFKTAISPLIKAHHTKALILGTGGASKAIAHALKTMRIDFDYVSRTKKPNVAFTYKDLNESIIKRYQIIINCTPIGTFPNIEACPDIPYQALNAEHLLFDLIYNPLETEFLRLGKVQGAATCNGYAMLEFQAEKAWKIWALV